MTKKTWLKGAALVVLAAAALTVWSQRTEAQQKNPVAGTAWGIK
jgi:hypothetical protein